MTLFVYLNGVDVSSRIRLEDGFQTITSAADGAGSATAGLKFDDADSSLTVGRFQSLIINESDCSQPRLFTGYVMEARPSRGPYRQGTSRVWNVDVGDLNLLLHLQAFHTSDAKRPQETGTARVNWLLGTTPGSYVKDHGKIAANTATYDEADYRGRYPDDVLPDVCETSSTNKVFFVYRDTATGEPSLFLDVPTVGLSTSSLSISNNEADASATVFGPKPDAELVIDMGDVYDEVIVNWTGGQSFLANHDGRLPTGIHRTAVFETPRIGRVATAQTHATFYLAAHAGDIETITCTIQVPSSQVNLIDAGMLVPVKFTHLPGYTAFTNLRVARRTVNLAVGTNLLYDITLTLSTRGVSAPGGGSGGFPQQPGGPVTIVQQNAGANDRTMPAPITDGSTMVLAVGNRDSTFPGGSTAAPPGYALGAEGVDTNPYGICCAGATDTISLWTKTASGEVQSTATAPWAGNTIDANMVVAWYELSTGAEIVAHNAGGNSIFGTAASLPAVSMENGDLAIVIFEYEIGDAVTGPFFTPGAGLTEDCDARGFDGHPAMFAGHHTATGTESFTATATLLHSGPWMGQIYVFRNSAGGASSPPSPGQTVPWAVVTVTPGSTTSTGTTAFPYATGSLQVKVDGVLISTASYTETDPTTGAFTLNWVIDADEVVTVSYLGR